jgi:transcriptional regulator with PAS, ATPase and Fis domain
VLGIPARRDNVSLQDLSRQRATEAAEAAGFIVRGAAMLDALEQGISVAKLDMPVLVQGETGTGKEFVVSLIHKKSARADRCLISVNCAALAETLLDTELFGHVRGAFTGAVSEKPGLFELADGGTLFLDEIGEMPPSLQAKLLRVLENGEMRRIGSTRSINTNVRVLAATHRDLRAMVESGEFRRDLYFRLNSFVIHLPALRERRESIPPLVQNFLRKTCTSFEKNIKSVSPEVMARLMAYPWPGNVRELKHAIERAVVVAHDEIIEIGDLPGEILNFTSRVAGTEGIAKPSFDLKEGERQMLEKVLAQNQGNRTATARVLNISITTLWRKMRRFGLT